MVEEYSVREVVDALRKFAKLTTIHAQIILRQAGIEGIAPEPTRNPIDPEVSFDRKALRLWKQDSERLLYLVRLWKTEIQAKKTRQKTAYPSQHQSL